VKRLKCWMFHEKSWVIYDSGYDGDGRLVMRAQCKLCGEKWEIKYKKQKSK